MLTFLFFYSQRVNDILQFISDFTVDVEGVGDVCRFSFTLETFLCDFKSTFVIVYHVKGCLRVFFFVFFFSSLSAFDFESHGNSNYGSPYNTTQQRRSSQGKMEKSFLRYAQVDMCSIFLISLSNLFL